MTCSITGITQKFSVTWKNSADQDLSGTGGTLDEYAVAEGTFNTAKQESTLTITPAGLTALTQETTSFTCIVKSGEYSTTSPDVTKTQALTKLTYGTYTTTFLFRICRESEYFSDQEVYIPKSIFLVQ